MEEFLEDFDVGDFYTDVAVEASCDEAGDDVHDVGCCLPVVRGETLHDGIEGVLALIAVDENAEEEVHDIDENVGAEDPFPEVPGVSHLSEEGDEEHGSSVGIDGLVETVQGADEAGTAGGHSVRRRAGVGVDGSWSEVRSERCLSRGIIGRRIGCNAHGNKQNEQVDPYGEICQPAESLKCSDLADDHASGHEDDQAHNEADAGLRHLRDGLTVGENEDGNRKQELDCLQDIHAVSCPSAVNSEEAICITLHRISVGVQCHEDFPELESEVHSEATENSVQGHTWSAAHLSKCPRDREGTQDISGDQVENTTPPSSPNSSGSIFPFRICNPAKVATGGDNTIFIVRGLLSIRVIIGCWRVKRSRFLVALGKSALDDALEALGSCSSDKSLIGDLLIGTSNCCIVHVFFKRNAPVMDVMRELFLNRLIVSKCGVGWITGIVALKG